MKPLLFLTTRSIFNGLKRAVTTPRRLITIIFFLGYYFFFFVRPGLSTRRTMFPEGMRLAIPAVDVVEAVVFAVFVALSMLLMLSIFSQLTGFKPADVDMLFATPVSPKLILGFRVLRDYITTLLVPILFGAFAVVPIVRGWEALFRNMPNPESGPVAIRAMMVAWLLMALVWVTITYALNLFINRSDLQSDTNKKVLIWSVVTLFGTMVVYLILSLSTVATGQEAVQLAHSPVLRTFFFTAGFATMMVEGPLRGEWGPVLIGGGSMLLISVVALRIAISQAGWMYDQAAVKGFGSSERRLLQQKGDFYGMVASAAREGKIKPVRESWLHKLKLQGPAALFWKDLFMQYRGMKFLMLLLFAIAVFMNLTPAVALGSSKKLSDLAAGFAFLGMQCITLLMMTMSYAQTGFVELLRRVDTQKPLPFTPATTVLMEVLSKSALGTVGAWASAVILLLVKPYLWAFVLGAIVVAPFVSMLISSAALLLTLMFPDIDDPSQRSLRGILMMLAIVLFAIPGGALAVGGFAMASAIGLDAPLAVLALAAPVAAVNLGVTVLVTTFAGGLYANYNPSE